jgi:hypothetical protein
LFKDGDRIKAKKDMIGWFTHDGARHDILTGAEGTIKCISGPLYFGGSSHSPISFTGFGGVYCVLWDVYTTVSMYGIGESYLEPMVQAPVPSTVPAFVVPDSLVIRPTKKKCVCKDVVYAGCRFMRSPDETGAVHV